VLVKRKIAVYGQEKIRTRSSAKGAHCVIHVFLFVSVIGKRFLQLFQYNIFVFLRYTSVMLVGEIVNVLSVLERGFVRMETYILVHFDSSRYAGEKNKL